MANMTLIRDCEERITKAKTALVIKFPFISMVALRLIFRNATLDGLGDEIDTAATDGKYCWWHEDFIATLSKEELMGLIAHEVMHVVWMHMFRIKTRDPLIWNYAGDYAINPTVMEMGLKLPPNGLFEEKYKDRTADWIYDDIIKNMPPPPPGGGSCQDGAGGDKPQDQKGKGKKTNGKGKPLWGEFVEPKNEKGKPLSEAEKAERQEDIKIMVKQAAEAAKAIGKLPAGLEHLIEALEKPTVNWEDYVPSWIKGVVPDNYTWVRPNRSLMANYGIYMPSMQLTGAGIGVLSVDNSGSVSNPELIRYVSNIVGLIEQVKPDKLYIVQHDAIVQKVDVWESGDDFTKLLIKGRGGTYIKPVYRWLDEIDEEINWMIHFTDMGIGDFPKAEEAPDFPVLWAATGPDRAPYGTYLSLKDALA